MSSSVKWGKTKPSSIALRTKFQAHSTNSVNVSSCYGPKGEGEAGGPPVEGTTSPDSGTSLAWPTILPLRGLASRAPLLSTHETQIASEFQGFWKPDRVEIGWEGETGV